MFVYLGSSPLGARSIVLRRTLGRKATMLSGSLAGLKLLIEFTVS
jgi:hypothetical protein